MILRVISPVARWQWRGVMGCRGAARVGAAWSAGGLPGRFAGGGVDGIPGILVEKRARLGVLTLNRPQSLNVLSFGIIQSFTQALADFARDPAIDAVLVQAEGPSFCSGGDVLFLVSYPPGSEFERIRRQYFTAEYRLNYLIHTYPKPYVAIIDGVTIGGGCGLSLHGSHVVATERTVLSMPETSIGHFPDVGASWFLNRLRGHMGVYIGLRGLRLNGADTVALGLGTHYMASDQLPHLVAALYSSARLEREGIDAILARFARPCGPSAAESRQDKVDQLFCGDSVEAILLALEGARESWAEAALATLRHASPRSLKVTLRMLREGRHLSIEEALRTEYRICVRVTASDDFREGVRAALVDKDNRPQWQPVRIEALDAEEIAGYFMPLAPHEPELDFTP
jgi:enoyl-CoA hydratase